MDFHAWIGLSAASERLEKHLRALHDDADLDKADVKAYSDAVYFNLYDVGISLVFSPAKGYKVKTGAQRTELNESLLTLSSVDVYNHEATLEPPASKLRASEFSNSAPTTTPARQAKYKALPRYPIRVDYINSDEQRACLKVTPGSVGKDFVEKLGEPERKGGGHGSLGIWTEWTSNGLMVEFASAGLQAWDKGGEATWRTLTFFERGEAITTES